MPLLKETKTKLQELEKESKELRQLLDQLEEKKSMAQAEREDLETELQTVLHKALRPLSSGLLFQAEQKETAEPATEACGALSLLRSLRQQMAKSQKG